MAKQRRHKMFRRAPSKPRAPRPRPGPARAGFTYGYQWSAVQPPDLLRFPMEYEGTHYYPVKNKRTAATQILVDDPKLTSWWSFPLLPTVTVPGVDPTRIAVAMDWHEEHGFDLNPYHLSGKSWGAVKFMRGLSAATNRMERFNGSGRRHQLDPVQWMNELVDYWQHCEWDKAKTVASLWWLDHELKHPDDWYDLRERLWPQTYAENANDLIEEQHRIAEELGEDEPDEPDEPEEGDIITEDYLRWYQDGRLYASGPDHASAENAVRARANAERFWPNLWVQDDHGGMMLIRGFRWN